MTIWPGRVEVGALHDAFARVGDLVADPFERVGVDAEHGGHRAGPLVARPRHQLPAQADEPEPFEYVERTGRGERAVLAEAVACRHVGRVALLLQHGERGEAVDVERGLRHVGLRERGLLLICVAARPEHPLFQREIEVPVGLVDDGAGLGESLVEVGGHADELGALAGEEKGGSHRGRGGKLSPGAALTSESAMRAVVGPLEVGRAPREAAAEGREDEVVAGAEFVLPVVEAEREGSGGRVAVALDVDHHLVAVDAHPVRRRVDDAEVGLVRDEVADVVAGEPVALHHLGRDIGHAADGELEHLPALLIEVVLARCRRSRAWSGAGCRPPSVGGSRRPSRPCARSSR